MMATETMAATACNDAELVAETLGGNRDAFSQIVVRYQSLICSLAYSATGSLGQSEDLAQETFITAWRHLRLLREPAKFRAWLCGIARNRINNTLRREGREPLTASEPLETAHEVPASEPSPPDQAISREEAAILWRALERIPQLYREPLVLFYREQQSIEAVAQDLGLSEEAVKQRLSRGRKLLQEQFLAFVAGALKQTKPGKTFTLGVIAALPLLATTAKAATVGTALAQHGSVAAKTTASGGFLQASAKILLGCVYWMGPVLPLGGYIGYKMGGDRQHSEWARRSVATFWRIMGASMLLVVFLPPLLLLLSQKVFSLSDASIFPFLQTWGRLSLPAFVYAVAPLSLLIWFWQRRRSIDHETAGGAQVSSQVGRFTTIWVVLAMTGALVCLALFFVVASVTSHMHFPQTRRLSTAEVQNLIAKSKMRDIDLSLTQYHYRNGFRHLMGEVRENGTPASAPPDYSFAAPAEDSTLALLAEKGISYKTESEGRDFPVGSREVLWLLGRWAAHLLMPAFCFFIVVAGAATLLRRRDSGQCETTGPLTTDRGPGVKSSKQPSEPRPIAAARNERRVDKAFAALAACGMIAVAVLLGVTTNWKVRRVAVDQVSGIIAQHKNARFEVFEYQDSSRKLWISDRRSPDFIAPADESTLGLLTRQGITYRTCLASRGWFYREPDMLGTFSPDSTNSSAQPHPSSSGRPGLSQSTSALGILVLAAAAGSLLWWVVRSRPISISPI
jgi:RNA polymerase sigma factor (sigma-70 family)